MQNSIWKIVTVVGIIGIGTLVVLEVQQRLPQMQNMPVASLPDETAEFAGAETIGSEQFLTPDSTTDFDQLMSDRSASDSSLGFDESALTEPTAVVPPAGNSVASAIDTTVRRSAMYEGDSPFSAIQASASKPHANTDGSGVSVAGGTVNTTAGDSSEVKTVSFQQDGAFVPGQSGVAVPGTGGGPRFPALDLSDSGDSFGGSGAPPFGAREGDDANPFGSDVEAPGAAGGSNAAAPSPRRDDSIMFFSPDETAGEGRQLPGSDSSAGNSGVADSDVGFFRSDSDPAPGASVPLNNSGGQLEGDPFGGSSVPVNSGGSTADPVLPLFGDDPVDGRPVPVGRVPQGRTEDFGPDPFVAPASNGGTASERPSGSPSLSNDRSQPVPAGNDELPFFTEDIDSTGNAPVDAGAAGRGGAVSGGAAAGGGGAVDDVLFPQADNLPRASGAGTVPRPATGSGSTRDLPSLELPQPDQNDFENPRNPFNDIGSAPSGRVPTPNLNSQNSEEFPPLPDRPTGSIGSRPVLNDRMNSNSFDDLEAMPPRIGNDIPSRDDGFPGLDPLPRSNPNDSGAIDRSGSDGNPAPVVADLTTTSEIMRPHVTLRKDAPETASVGVPLDYIITVSNEGQSTAYEVAVEDELAQGVNLENTNPVADFDRATRKLRWKFDELPSGQQKQIRVQVIPTGEGTLDSTASVRFKAQVKASTVITAPKLALELSGPTEVKLGDEVNFRYLVRNDGSGSAQGVLLRSVLPAGLKHSEGNDLEYEISSLASGEEREIVLTVVAAEPGEYHNTAEVTSAGVASAMGEAVINIVGSQLKVERLGPERRYVGRPAQFQNIVSNETNFEATNCVVLERVPVGMKFVAAPNAQYNPQDRVITWRIDRIAPGKQVVLDVDLMPEAPGDVDTIVEVVENAGFRSRATKTVAVEDIHNVSADISRLDGPVAVGEKFTFAITVDNRGTANANEVQLTIQVPRQIKVIAAGSQEAGISARHQLETNAVLYNPILKVEPGQVKTFQLVLQGQQPVKNALVKAQLKYAEMMEPLVVSESVTVYSDSL